MNVANVFRSDVRDSTIVNATVSNCKFQSANVNGASCRNGFFRDVTLYSLAGFSGKYYEYHPIILQINGFYITCGDKVMTFGGETKSIRRWKQDIKDKKIDTDDPAVLSAIKFVISQTAFG